MEEFFTSLFNYLMSVWTRAYLSYILHYNSILCYLLCCSNYSRFGHWMLSLVGFCVSLTCSHLSVFGAFSYFLVLQRASGSSCFSFFRSAINHFSKDPFYWKMVFRNQNTSTEYVCCSWDLCLLYFHVYLISSVFIFLFTWNAAINF